MAHVRIQGKAHVPRAEPGQYPGLGSTSSRTAWRMQVYYIPAGDAPLTTNGFVPLVASDANSVKYDHYDDYDACYVRRL
jgi:hypothetical protein